MRVVVVAGASPTDFEQVLVALPANQRLAVIAHCSDPTLVSRLHTAPMKVTPVISSTRIEANQIYIVPTDARVDVQERSLVVTPKTATNNSLDVLFRSAADQYGAQTIGVILAGRGSGGVLGLKRIKEVGGITLAQAGVSADAEQPRVAIASGLVDLVLPSSAIASRLQVLTEGADSDDPSSGSVDTLRDILTMLRVRSGHDFAAYKRATLFRRVSRRMQVCQVPTILDYQTYLREHPNEIAALLRDFLISVTSFFRDQEAFDALATVVVPKLFSNRSANEQIRVWVPGCASGEETYSIAILLAEHAAKHKAPESIQVFATDIDEDSLAEARLARYPENIAVDVSPERLERFFTRDQGGYRINKELREMVLFSPHNLLRDPPFSRLDLVSCRNLMIYLNREAQDRVLNLFHFGLRPDGYLFLGTSESADNSSLFAAIDPKHRVFQRQLSTGPGLEALLSTGRWHTPTISTLQARAVSERPSSLGDLHFRVIEQYAPPSVLVSADLDVLHVSEHAGKFLVVQGGEPTTQILRLAHPALRLDLRTAMYAAKQPGGGNETRVVKFEDNGRTRIVEIKAVAHKLDDVAPGALLVLFDEKDADGEPIPDPVPTTIEPIVREMEDELHRTRDQLRTTIEQYETSNEELKASNEELQAMNEELRSATEELETSKEELQSVNEELTTLNHELKVKVDEISHANSDLQNLMSSTDIGVLFLDRQLNIKRFTPRARDLFNVIPTDIGRPLSHLTHRLQSEDIEGHARRVLEDLRSIEREVPSKDGKTYLMRVLPYRSVDDRIEGVVVTFVDITALREAVEARRRSEQALRISEERMRFALEVAPVVILGMGRDGSIWGFVRGKALPETAVLELFARGHADRFQQIAQKALAGKAAQRVELDLVIDGTTRTYDFRVEPMSAGVNAVGFDITPSKLAEASLLEADRRKDEFLATLSHELRDPMTPLKVALDVARLAEGKPAQREESFRIMERQVAQIEKLVDELLDLSRIAQGKLEIKRASVDLATVIAASLEATRPLIDQYKHEVAVDVPDGTHTVIGDSSRLVQILTNLLTNAAKYTRANGRIAVSLVPQRTSVQLRVRDNGSGIAADLLPRIFDIFVQGRERANGLGIGLNLVKRLAELHGGTVTASSAGENHGSEFVVDLPVSRV